MKLPSPSKVAGIWHQMGHIHYEHYLRSEFNNQEHMRAIRISDVKKGKVLLFEKQADHFAVIYSVEKAMIGFLKLLLSTRPKGGMHGWNGIGKQELQLRITAIRAYG